MSWAREVVTLASALGCAVAGGVFFAFSTFVMNALARLAPAQGIAAMQSINRSAINPLFMGVLFGTALAGLGLGVWALVSWGAPSAAWTLAGVAVYLVGAIAVTVAANVPQNESLATLDPHDAAAADAWDSYLAAWTAWNDIRAISALAAAALLVVALVEGRTS